MNHGKIGSPMLLPLFMAPLTLPQVKLHITLYMVLTNAFRMTCLCTPVPLHSLEDYSKLQLHCFQTIHESVRENLKASREEMLHKQHAQATPVTIQVG